MVLIATDPKLLLLDEVFVGLTYGEIEQISKLLVKRKETHGTTYMIVSHDLKSLAPLVDRVIVIHDGSVLCKAHLMKLLEIRKYRMNIWEQVEAKHNDRGASY